METDVNTIITKVLATTEVVATEGFEAAVAGAYAQGITALLIVVVLVIGWSRLLLTYIKAMRWLEDEDAQTGLTLGFAVTSAVMVTVSIIAFDYGLPRLIAPEWYAIENLMELL